MDDQLVTEAGIYTTYNKNKQSFPPWESNPQSQQLSTCRPTPYCTATGIGIHALYMTFFRMNTFTIWKPQPCKVFVHFNITTVLRRTTDSS